MNAPTVSEAPQNGQYAGRSHAEYKRAQAHSRLVRALKIILPLSAALVVVVFVVVSWFDNVVPDGVGIDSALIRDGKLIMQNPVMSGQSSDGRPYTMQAARAIQDLSLPDVIVLEDIVADLPAPNGNNARLNAISGTFNRAAQTMSFDKAFSISTEDGMTAQLQSAEVDMANGGLVSNAPVSISTGEATVVAQSMQMTDKGRVIIFKDKVRMTIKPSALKSKDGVTN